MRITILFVLMLISVEFCASQNQIDYSKVYQKELKKLLQPQFANSDTVELFAFRVIPETEPNSPLRIIEVKGMAYLEAIYLEKNIWCELFSQISKHTVQPFTINKNRKHVQISKVFKDKMIKSCMQVVEYVSKKTNGKSQQLYDGMNYDFISYINGNEIAVTAQNVSSEQSNYCMMSIQSYINHIIQLNLKIMTDIRNKSFDESKYDMDR